MARTLAATRDLTTGSIHRNIWRLALPMTAEMAMISLTFTWDTYWVARLGSVALAAATISTTIRWVMSSLSSGLGVGGLAVVARRVGERDPRAANHATTQAILLGFGVALLIGGLGLLLAEPLLRLLGADAEVLPLGLEFLRITFGGLFTIAMLYMINALLRGAGEAGRAVQVLVLSNTLTIVLEPLLIFGWGDLPGLGIRGAALAYVLGSGAGVLFQLVILARGRAHISIDLRDLRPDFPLMGRIIAIAMPSTLQMVLRSSSRLVILAIVGLYGTFATAGYGVANRILIIALIPGFGFGNAGSTLVGQNLGAGQPGRAEKSAWSVTAYTVALMGAAALLFFIFSQPLVAFFDDTPQALEVGTQALHIIAPSLLAAGAGIALGRCFDGAGDTVPAMIVNLLTLWGIEAPLAYGLARWAGMGLTGVWYGRAIANLANGVLFAVWFRLGRWKRRQV
jgi:putative MATE family efflux protein